MTNPMAIRGLTTCAIVIAIESFFLVFLLDSACFLQLFNRFKNYFIFLPFVEYLQCSPLLPFID